MARSLLVRFFAPLLVLALVIPTEGGTVPVMALDGSDGWSTTYLASGGTADIVGLSGIGGNLEYNAPDGNGVVKLTTDNTNQSRAEIAVSGNFGKVSDLLTDGLTLNYSYFKQSTGNKTAAASLKLTFSNGTSSATLIYEPYWNQTPPGPGKSGTPPLDDWATASIDLNNGVFWTSGGFGQSNGAGGPPLMTIQDWASAFNADFQNASLTKISVGIGTYNTNTVTYFDHVEITTGASSTTYDFQIPQAVPEPTTLVSAGIAISLIGLGALRGRRRETDSRVAC